MVLGRLFVLAKIDKKKVKKINDLLKIFSRNPFEGIGNRTIETQVCWILVKEDDEHRLIYRFIDDEIQILKCNIITTNGTSANIKDLLRCTNNETC
jgi:toxin YoeB